MEKEELLKSCRYYTGKDPGAGNESEFTAIERVWVQANLKEDAVSLSEWYISLVNHRLLGWANSEYPDIPTTLVGAILCRYLHFITYRGKVTAKEFKAYFRDRYMAPK